MTKIYKADYIQKGNEPWVRYWTEEKPERHPIEYYQNKYCPNGAEDEYRFNEQKIYDWERAFKEVRIHPSQVEAFKELAFQHELNTCEKVRPEQGVSLPPDNIEIEYDCQEEIEGCKSKGCKCIGYAFLNAVDKEEKPDEEYLRSQMVMFDPSPPEQKERLKKRSDKIELLEAFALFLECNSYLDTDWRTEEPFAIDEFLRLNP